MEPDEIMTMASRAAAVRTPRTITVPLSHGLMAARRKLRARVRVDSSLAAAGYSRPGELPPLENRNVVAVAPLEGGLGSVRRRHDVPLAVGRPEDRDVGLAVAVEVAGQRRVV